MGNSDGEHKIKSMPVAFDRVSKVMDEETYQWHHDKHYAGYVDKRNEIEKSLATVDRSKANVNYSAYRAMKLEETWNGNGMLLHEVYWKTMGGDGKPDESSAVVKAINESFGSFDAWKADFIAAGKSGRGWVVLSVDVMTDGKLRNFMYDAHNNGGVVGSMPLIAADTFEHAYYHKFGPDRAAYLAAVVENIDWARVDAAYAKAKR